MKHERVRLKERAARRAKDAGDRLDEAAEEVREEGYNEVAEDKTRAAADDLDQAAEAVRDSDDSLGTDVQGDHIEDLANDARRAEDAAEIEDTAEEARMTGRTLERQARQADKD